MSEGWREHDACRAVLLDFNGVEQVKKMIRDVRIGAWVHQVVQDLRYGARTLRRSPAFALSAVLILSLAIGANTAVFSIIEGVMLRPLPYQEPERLCVLWKSVPHRSIEWDWTSAPTIRDWYQQSQVFADMVLILRPEASRVVLQHEAGPVKVQGSIVSGNFFDLLGAKPLLGRTFSLAEEQRGDDVAVLSHRVWKQQFGGNQAVVGQTVRIDHRSVTVLGVMPPEFEFPDKDTQLWLLLSADPRWPLFQMPRFRIADAFCGLARIKRGVTLAQVRMEMQTLAAHLAEEYPATDKGLGVGVIPLADQVAGPRVRIALWTLQAAVLSVLLIACANLAGLIVARNVSRQRELIVRAALGAGRARLTQQLTMECLLLALAGGIGGILLAHTGLHALLALTPADLPRADGIAVNSVVWGASFGLCVFTVLGCGLLPAWWMAGRQAPARLHDQRRGVAGGPGRQMLQGMLVAAQNAVAMVLLSGAGLLIHSLMLLDAVDRGFDPTHLLTVSLSLPLDRYQDRARAQAFFDQVIQRVVVLPGVVSTATGETVLGGFRGNVPNQQIVIEGRPFSQKPNLHARIIVHQDYFRTLGIPVREGRLFLSADREHTPPVAVINETMAHRFWPGEAALGKRFKQVLPGMNSEWVSVVGVVKDVIYNRDGVVIPVFYRSVRQWYTTERELVVRTAIDPLALTAAVRQAIQAADPALPQVDIKTVEEQLAQQDQPRRFQTNLLTIFAGSALLLAVTGLYGLVAYSVEQRTKEIGIRMALGSTRAGVARHFLKQGLRWGSTGIVIGLLGTLPLGRVLSASLYGVTPMDAGTLTAVTVTLALAVGLTSLFPALRASQVDPETALRQE